MITLEKHLAAHASVNPGEEDAHLILGVPAIVVWTPEDGAA